MRGRLLALALALAAAVSPGCASAPASWRGDTAPEAALLLTEWFEDLASGERATLGALRGQVLLIDFFATWCLPCADSLPIYDAWQRELGPRGFKAVVVSLDEDRAEAAPFLARLAPGLAAFWDPEGRVAGLIGLEGMPTAYVLDREGNLLSKHEGFRPGDASRLRAQIEAALVGAPLE